MKKILILCPLDVHNTEVMMSKVNETFKVQSNIFFAGFSFNLLKAMSSGAHKRPFINLYIGVAKDETLKSHFNKEGFFIGLLDKNEQVDEIWVFDKNTTLAQEIALSLDETSNFYTTHNSNISREFNDYEELIAAMKEAVDEL